MKNSKIIAKIARFFAIISFVFVIFSAIVTFYLLQIGSPSAPIECIIFVILSNIIPYLFITALSLVIAFTAGSSGAESAEKEASPSAQPETVSA